MKSSPILVRLSALAGLLIIMKFAFSDGGDTFAGYLDIKAALLVFVAPWLVSVFFLKSNIPWRATYRRVKETKDEEAGHLHAELLKATPAALGLYGASTILKMSEESQDSFFKYASHVYASRFKPEEMSLLLTQRIEAEDSHWQAMGNFFGFLAKMAPYFGMLATVMGMIKLLQNMSEFAKISGGMALAMQGTLYGLISFTMVYSPLQKLVLGYRDGIFRRNEMIARWFLLVAQKADPIYIQEELRSSRLAGSPSSEFIREPFSAEPSTRQV